MARAERGAGRRPGAAALFAPLLVAIVALAIGVRIAVVLGVDPDVPEVGDASAYHLLAENLAAGEGYIRPFDLLVFDVVRPTAEYPPLFPAAVAVPAALGIDGVQGQRLVMGLVGAAAVAVVGLLGRRVGGPVVGLVAAALAAVYPMLFLSDATLTPETLFVLLVSGALLLALRVVERPSLPRCAALGLAVGLAALTRAEALLLVPLLAVPAPLLRRGRPRAWGGAAIAVVVAAAVVLPWTARNYARFDALVPVSNNVGTALDGANCPQTYSGDLVGFWLYTPTADCFEGFDQRALARTDEAAVAAEHRRQGVRYARGHVERLPVVATARVLRTWGLWRPVQQTRLESLEGRPLAWQRAGTAMYYALAALAVPGVVLLRRRRTPVWPFLAVVAGATVTSLLTYGNQRFRVAAEPALLVLAAVTLVAAGNRVLAGRREAAPVEAAA